jgi:hypothetical protein
VKKPSWLPWRSNGTKFDDLKKVRRQTDQRMKRQDAQKEQHDAAEKRNQALSSAKDLERGIQFRSENAKKRYDEVTAREDIGAEVSPARTRRLSQTAA